METRPTNINCDAAEQTTTHADIAAQAQTKNSDVEPKEAESNEIDAKEIIELKETEVKETEVKVVELESNKTEPKEIEAKEIEVNAVEFNAAEAKETGVKEINIQTASQEAQLGESENIHVNNAEEKPEIAPQIVDEVVQELGLNSVADATELPIQLPSDALPKEKLYLSTTRFSSLPLHEALQESLEDLGFTYCTPIQAESLPHLLNGRDLTGQAQTGTGKSAAFLLTILNHLMITPVAEDVKGPYAIVLAPTRELALQIYKDASVLGRYTGLKYCAVYGGTGYDSQRKQLDEGVDLIIGTPGRVIDFFKQGVFTLKNIEVFVLDEADRMFDLGFVADIRYLLSKMPPPGQRLNMLFSATFSQRVLELAYEHMNNPEKVIVESEHVTGDRITQYLFHIASTDKIKLLFGLLHKEKPIRSIIFVNTKRVADEVSAYLEGNDIKAAVLSGDIPQNRRERLLEAFKHGILPVLVATDVAARGLHIPEVSHVFNYDLPQDVEDYVHRIGRTARAGAEGTAISFACEEYVYSLPDIEEYIGQAIQVSEIEDGLLFEPNPPKFSERSERKPGRRIGHPSRRNQPRRPS